MAMVGAAIGPMLVYPAIYAVKLIRAPLRQRDEARQQIDNQFRPKIMLPSAKRKLYEDFIKRGEALLDELTEPDANQRLDDVYTRIALWETAVSARLRPLQLRGAMSSELDMMGAGVDSISLKEYVETRLRNLWHAQEPHRMPATHYPQPALPRLTEPRRAVGVSGTDSVYVGSDDRTE